MPTLAQLSEIAINNLNQQNTNSKPIKIDNLRFCPGQLVTIGARPSMGKTLFLLYVTQTIIEQSKDAILFWSNEESEETLFKKLCCQISSVEYSALDHVLDEVIIRHKEKLTSPNVILRYEICSWEQQKEQLIESIQNNNVKFILIDKLQGLCTSNHFGNRDQELDYIIKDLKQIATEYSCIILMMSTLNRSVEHREGKRPQLSDLRGSGSIESNSDMVVFLHRPEYYGITEDEDGNSLIGVAEAIVAKNRSGKLGNFLFRFNRNIPQFQSFDHYTKVSFAEEFERINGTDNEYNEPF